MHARIHAHIIQHPQVAKLPRASGNAGNCLPFLPFWVYRGEGRKRQTKISKSNESQTTTERRTMRWAGWPPSSLYISYLSSFCCHSALLFGILLFLFSLHHLLIIHLLNLLGLYCHESSAFACHLLSFSSSSSSPLYCRSCFAYPLSSSCPLINYLQKKISRHPNSGTNFTYHTPSKGGKNPKLQRWHQPVNDHPGSFDCATGTHSKLNISVNQEQTQHNTKKRHSTRAQSRQKNPPPRKSYYTSTTLLFLS